MPIPVPITVSVVVCTWNRAALLAKGLEAIAALDVPAGCEWELVVVDNACTDDTPAVLERFAERLPLRRVSEPRLGLSRAQRIVEGHGGRITLENGPQGGAVATIRLSRWRGEGGEERQVA